MPKTYPFKQRLLQLDSIINALGWLWRPQPFKESRPAWCEQLPELTEALLQLTERELSLLSNSHPALINWLVHYLPELEPLIELCELPPHSTTELKAPDPHLTTAIPGRKLEQIELFAAAVGVIENPVVEWCGGKGHLGRRLALNWQQDISTIEYNAKLCRAGETLAKKAKVKQRFYKVDVLSPDSTPFLPQRHAVALHACGDLHRTLIRRAVEAKSPAIDLVPCCYHLGHLEDDEDDAHDEQYNPFTEGLQLRLDRDALRLA
ncbi:MAG: methyltransferase, partial [Gammaproteobacteria bacterium]|nr:methyltransferase [Gammaproteobacteria bacterium]